MDKDAGIPGIKYSQNSHGSGWQDGVSKGSASKECVLQGQVYNKYNWYLGEVKRLWEKNGKSLDKYLRAYWLGETDGKEDKVGGKHMNIVEEAVTDMELFGDSVGV